MEREFLPMEETFYRDEALGREARTLPAQTYNLTRVLLAQSGRDCLFVPIRSMQYLAVIDHEEIIFVHREGRRMIELAWQKLDPHGRTCLDDPVPYEVVYYLPEGPETMKRLQGEFLKALQQLAARRRFDGPARVIKLRP